MKKLILGFSLLSFIACDQEEVSPLNTSTEQSVSQDYTKSPVANHKALGSRHLIYINDDPNYPPTVKCVLSGNSCMETVVITGAVNPNSTNAEKIEEIIYAIKVSSQANIKNVFSANEQFLETYIDSKYVDGTISGDYIVLSPEAENPDELFITFGASTSLDDVEMAFPFTLD